MKKRALHYFSLLLAVIMVFCSIPITAVSENLDEALIDTNPATEQEPIEAIEPRDSSDEDTNLVMSVSNIFWVDGENVKHQIYTDDTDYRDEWVLHSNSLFYWFSQEYEGGFWQTAPRVYVENAEPSNSFYFSESYNSAISQWEAALSIDLTETGWRT